MGRPPPPPTPPTTSVVPEEDEDGGAICCCCGGGSGGCGGNRCCTRNNWSWLLYVLVLASLSLSILVFWLSLYKSQEAGMALRTFQEEQNDTVAKLVDARLLGLRTALSDNQRQLQEHASSIFELQKVLEVHSASTRETEHPRSGEPIPKGIREGVEDDSYDYVLEMITDVRSEHGIKIDDLNEKLSGWQASTEKALQILYRLRADMEEHSSDMEEVKERLETTKDTIDNEQKEKTKAVEKRVATVKAELTDLVSSNRRDMLEAMGQLDRRTDEESRRLRTLEDSILDIEGDVEVNLNTTAYLENKMLVMERDGEKDQFERQVMRSLQNLNSTLRTLEAAIEEQQMNEITGAFINSANASLQVQSPPSTDSTAALAGLERRVLQHDDHLRRLDADAEEDASAILANQNSLVRLSEMVYYFRQNVLKVKKLPAMMNALERRIEVLDDNFAKLILSRPRSNEDTEVEDEGV